jgi:hypothetical protein
LVDTALPDTLEPPPRLTGNQAGDVIALREWCWALYNNLILSGNLTQTGDLGALALLDTVGPAEIDPTSVIAGTYGDATHVAQITVDVDGRLTEVTEIVFVAASGDVVGPGIAGDGDFALFDGVTGKLIKDSGIDATDFDAAGAATAAQGAAASYTDTAIAGVNQYSDEKAQDAVGLNVDAGLLYDDATPKFSVVRIIAIPVTDPNGSSLTTGDGKAYLRINSLLNGYNLTAVAAHVTTVSSSGIPTFQIANVTDAVDMLSTKLTIDASEKDSKDATTPAVIDTTKDDVATGDELRIDCDVAGTGTKGLIVELTFSRP